jgi:predicted RNA-binding protein
LCPIQRLRTVDPLGGIRHAEVLREGALHVGRSYWLDLFTGTTWDEFLAAGGEVSGFRERRWRAVQQMKPGDYLLCYMTGISRWIGVLEVVSDPFKDSAKIWKDEDFPCRVKVKPVVTLTPETAVPVHELRGELSAFQNLTNPHAWTGYFRGSPARWKASDGEAVLAAVREAEENPVSRPVDTAKLTRRPKALKTALGPVTVPDSDDTAEEMVVSTTEAISPAKEPTVHTETQWRLLKLGSDMGLDVWVARNDRGREWKGHRFADIPRLRAELPRQFDEATNRTIELIDVLWLTGNAIVAAFEIESTTSIYSGLLRMSDLVAMQPNLNIPLYLVAPDERRQKVFAEVNRPTFSRLSPPLVDVCRYIAFSTLQDYLGQIGAVVRYLKPEFLDELAESCALEED